MERWSEDFEGDAKIVSWLENLPFKWRLDASGEGIPSGEGHYVAPLGEAYIEGYMSWFEKLKKCLERGIVANGFAYKLVDKWIFRARFTAYTGIHEVVAQAYDQVWSDKDEVEISRDCFSRVPLEANDAVLDVGCGTGMLIDYRFDDLYPGRYIGIDPSRGMLSALRDKHPRFGINENTACTFEEYFANWHWQGKFNVVTGMFGAASFMGPPEWVAQKIHWLLKPGGTAVLMYFKETREQVQERSKQLYSQAGLDIPEYEMVYDPITAPMWRKAAGPRGVCQYFEHENHKFVFLKKKGDL